MSNFQAGYVHGVHVAAVTASALRDAGKTPDEIAAMLTELAARLEADQDSAPEKP
ncbi:hypothetical protein [Streptomyces hydrogenans]|uniref:hypothetical protein n=1 Tax=Streptomyces hydrogenans TaxID=1873719 RepID=UPI0033FB02BA